MSLLSNKTVLSIAGVFFGSLFLIRYFCNGPKNRQNRDMNNKIVIVTGSSAGLGKETAKDLLNKGAKVIFACRDKNKTLNVINQITNESNKDNAIFMELNLTKFKSVTNFANDFSKKFDKLDLLINNAGLYNDKLYYTEDKLENTMQTNHISHFALTGLMLKYLKKSEDPRIINVSSMAHALIDNSLDNFPLTEKTYSPFKVYGITKAANIIFAENLKEFCESKNDSTSKILSSSLHPGVVATEFMRTEGRALISKILIWITFPIFRVFFKDEYMGAQTTLHCSYLDRAKFNNGGYYSDCKECNKDSIIRKFDLEKKINKMSYEAVVSSVVYEENKEDKDFVDYLNFFKTKF